MKIFFLFIIVAIIFANCNTTQNTHLNTQNDPHHHNFGLISVDGVSRKIPQNVNLKFSENMYISEVMCNRFMSQGELK